MKNQNSDLGLTESTRAATAPRIEMAPSQFSNALNDIYPEVTHENWRSLREWKMFVAGYNAAVTEANASIKAKYNMGQIADKLFGQSAASNLNTQATNTVNPSPKSNPEK